MSFEQIIYFFGAGVSKLVNLPTMNELWQCFENTLEEKEKEEYLKIKSVLEQEFNKSNIELFLSLLNDLSDDIPRKRLLKIYSELNFPKEVVIHLRKKTEIYIRKRLENINIKNFYMYYPILTLPSNKEILKIFTVNYDGLIEIICELNLKKHSDGFSPFWDPRNFDDKEIQIFKLHGSLFWLRTNSGQYLRIPLKGLNLENTQYITDENLSEMIIYPSMNKYKYTEIYSWLHTKFIHELRNSLLCIVFGYSFGDSDLKEIFVDTLKNNNNFWLIIISPEAKSKKLNLVNEFNLDTENQSRIIAINQGIDIIAQKIINDKIKSIKYTIQAEKKAWENQITNNSLNDEWNNVIKSYFELELYERMRYVLEELSKPSIILYSSGRLELTYGLEFINFINYYIEKKDLEKRIYG